MNIRWLIMDYVPPELGLMRRERREVYARALEMNDGRRRLNLTYMIGFGSGSTIGCVVMFTWPSLLFGSQGSTFTLNSVIRAMLFGMAPPLLGFVVAGVVGVRLWRPCVLAALKTQGYDVCARCGYWLRGLGKNVIRCPECGAAREPLPPAKSEAEP